MSTADEHAELLERAVHDLKNPLAVVRASLEWLEVELADRPDALDAVRDSATACRRLVRIADDLEVFARLETGGPIERRAVAVDPLLAAVRSGCSQPRDGSVMVAPSGDGVAVSGDAALLERALQALVHAAVRGARGGSVVDIVARRDGAMIAVTVAVRGAGEASTPEAAVQALASAGLGVHLALRIATAHGGGLDVVATDGVPTAVLRVPAEGGPPPASGGNSDGNERP